MIAVDQGFLLFPSQEVFGVAGCQSDAGIEIPRVVNIGIEGKGLAIADYHIARPDPLHVKTAGAALIQRGIERIGQYGPIIKIVTHHMAPMGLGFERAIRCALVKHVQLVTVAHQTVRLIGPTCRWHGVEFGALQVIGKTASRRFDGGIAIGAAARLIGG